MRWCLGAAVTGACLDGCVGRLLPVQVTTELKDLDIIRAVNSANITVIQAGAEAEATIILNQVRYAVRVGLYVCTSVRADARWVLTRWGRGENKITTPPP